MVTCSMNQGCYTGTPCPHPATALPSQQPGRTWVVQLSTARLRATAVDVQTMSSSSSAQVHATAVPFTAEARAGASRGGAASPAVLHERC